MDQNEVTLKTQNNDELKQRDIKHRVRKFTIPYTILISIGAGLVVLFIVSTVLSVTLSSFIGILAGSISLETLNVFNPAFVVPFVINIIVFISLEFPILTAAIIILVIMFGTPENRELLKQYREIQNRSDK